MRLTKQAICGDEVKNKRPAFNAFRNHFDMQTLPYVDDRLCDDRVIGININVTKK